MNAPSGTEDQNGMQDGNAPDYSFKRSVMGAPFEAWLQPDGLRWTQGRRSGLVPYCDIRRVRLSFRPLTTQSQRFRTEIWPERGAKLDIVSTSWRSMFDQERLTARYSSFIRELHRRIAAGGKPVRFETGLFPPVYWFGLATFVIVALALALMVVRALQMGAIGGGLFVAAFLAAFLWQAGNFFRRNRPQVYSADDLPDGLLPKE